MLMPTLRKYTYYVHKYKSFLRKSWALLLPQRYLFQGHSNMKRNNKRSMYTSQLLVKNIDYKRTGYVLLRNKNNDININTFT